MERKWWKEGVVYQVYPRSFYDSNGDGIGDLKGVTSKLDYLKELGIDIIWLNPIYKSPNADNGYDISDYRDIMDEFGTMEDFDELLCEAHKRGIRIIMDLVVNHTSDEHEWFKKSRESKDNPYRDFYIWKEGKGGKEPNDWKSCFGGPAWEFDKKTDEYYLHLFAVKQPDLNWENERLRKAIYDMMKFWLDKGIDGFRMDVINFISKDQDFPDDKMGGSKYYSNGPRVHEFLKEMNHEVLSKYDIMTVGETPSVTPEIAGDYVDESRKELNMIFQFELMGIDEGKGGKGDVIPWKAKDFKNVLIKWQEALKDKGWNSLYMNNHDQPRMVSRFGDDKNFRVESAKMLATVLHTLKGTPYIYQGEEIGMTNVSFDSIEDYNDIETLNAYHEKLNEGIPKETLMEAVHKSSRDNARTPMQWDDTLNAGFSKHDPWLKVNPNYKDINVAKALKDPNSIFYYYKKLIKMRKEYKSIVYGDFKAFEVCENVFSYMRTLGDERLFVVINLKGNNEKFILPNGIKYNKAEVILSNYDDENKDISNIALKPYEAIVYKLL
ncbi:MAG TPA: glucohydrolase [Clostridiaceae bacterium]|jgi:oligo-1,6-glucosidase|nr:glucohydrolase [Clostridiaceae bacterium]HBG38295.1 glucohydrolase [Clostridiaceae bacterium]HBN28003.1 glucohydrolase [Clostridiaceae bacterium]HBX48686.1 glucohydrolase [Clostridiaceae bacterium]HCL49749.1 glucohydrolase [Clostridiaceae bacterium]